MRICTRLPSGLAPAASQLAATCSLQLQHRPGRARRKPTSIPVKIHLREPSMAAVPTFHSQWLAPERVRSACQLRQSAGRCLDRGGIKIRLATDANDRTDMMRYVMRQKLLSFGDDFTIKDENNQDRYF